MDLFYHYLQIVFLGIVEGVTEFLPISSTGHLLIAEGLIHAHEPDVFNVVIQAGAILAVVFIYWHKIVDLFQNLDRPDARNYVLKIFAAFFVTGIIGIVLTKHFHLKLPETLVPVAWATLIGGLVIFAIEFLAKNLYPHDDVSWPEAILIGLGQILAGIFPGTSRSGATIMTGMAMGMKRTAATEFSFLLGIPTMFAASALDLVRYRKDLTTGDHQLLTDIALGFVVSAIVAFFVVKWLLHFIQSHTFNGFAIYRVLLGGILLIAIYTGSLPPGFGGDETANAAQVQPLPAPAPAVVTPAASSSTNATASPATPVPSTNQPSAAAPATNADVPPRALPVNPADLPPGTTNQPPANVPASQN